MVRVDGNGPVFNGGGDQSKKKVLITTDKLKGPLFEIAKKDDKGRTTQKTYYKDFNNDGNITEDEIYLVDRFYKNDDGTTSVHRFKDKDGDGYSDSRTVYLYDKSNQKVDEKTTKEENINAVKKRPHMDHEVVNRQMDLIEQGLAIDGVTPTPEPDPTPAPKPTKKKTTKEDEKIFNEAFDQSKLDDRIPTTRSLARAGYKKEGLMDMNGGEYFNGPNGSIRISNFDFPDRLGDIEGGHFLEYNSKDGKVKNQISYDKEGNAVKGYLSVKNDDGTVSTYAYKFDDNGNRVLIFKSTTLNDAVPKWEEENQ